jgi:polysaccharide biosynthesis/export protein
MKYKFITNVIYSTVVVMPMIVCALPARAAEPTAAITSYRLQPGDILSISAWKEAELQAPEVPVRPDGRVSFPLVGEVMAAGRSIDELRSEIETRLRNFVPDALVTVGVRVPAGNRIYVVGKVAKAGDFALNRPTDVMQALALAGGATPFADTNSIRVLRRVGTHQEAIEFHYGEVEHGRHLEQNILLTGGDTVVVP